MQKAISPSLKDFVMLTGLSKKVPLRKLLGSGNTKLPSTTAIFNFSSAKDCPSLKKGLCTAYVDGKHVCYAKKAEYSCYPNVLPFRRKQEKFWLKTSAEDFAAQFLAINITKRNPYKALRFSEAGDFHSQECIQKAEKIARILKKYGIKCYVYTSRCDLSYKNCEALIVNGSGFTTCGVTNMFKIAKKINEVPKGYGVCVGDCRICNRCMQKGMKTLIKVH